MDWLLALTLHDRESNLLTELLQIAYGKLYGVNYLWCKGVKYCIMYDLMLFEFQDW